jgi:hypothetical protein
MAFELAPQSEKRSFEKMKAFRLLDNWVVQRQIQYITTSQLKQVILNNVMHM